MKFKNETVESKMVNNIATGIIDIIENHINDPNWNNELMLKKAKLLANGLRTGKIGVDDILDVTNEKE